MRAWSTVRCADGWGQGAGSGLSAWVQMFVFEAVRLGKDLSNREVFRLDQHHNPYFAPLALIREGSIG